jgi:hypothetical protein
LQSAAVSHDAAPSLAEGADEPVESVAVRVHVPLLVGRVAGTTQDIPAGQPFGSSKVHALPVVVRGELSGVATSDEALGFDGADGGDALHAKTRNAPRRGIW